MISPQRAYRAACPNCGAPVDFASAASASAVCGFCRSTLLRDGETLRRIGVVAELFDDHSPLQLGASGKLQGQAFTLVGRLQYGYADGAWNEWHALFDSGRSAWLSEDNGAYVVAFDVPLAEAPTLDALAAGQRVTVAGQSWDVASKARAKLLSAQGELPRPPRLDGEFTVVDLRNVQGEVGTLDDADAKAVGWSIGRSVALSELALSGLREASEKSLAARSIECPSCGTSLEVKLASTQSISCTQCRAVVDLSQGAGADLAHYAQNNSGTAGLEPQIALGRSGTLALGGAPLPWQVVGYMERCAIEGDERSYWREYLLYGAGAGFAFLVDADEGWSWVKPITGVPQVQGSRADWQGVSYSRREGYPALVTWVQGEFYWRVRRDERTLVTDYASGRRRLSREQTGDEVTWSAGEVIDASVVAGAFGLGSAVPLARDVAPTSAASIGVGRALLIFFAIVIVLILVECSSSDDCASVRDTFGASSNEYQQCLRSQVRGSTSGSSGGSYGGWSSGGGGHK